VNTLTRRSPFLHGRQLASRSPSEQLNLPNPPAGKPPPPPRAHGQHGCRTSLSEHNIWGFRDVSTAGAALVKRVVADMAENGLRPDEREAELLRRASAAATRIAQLERVVRREGSTYSDRWGIVRPSPLLAEIRSQTLVLQRCLSGIQMTRGASRNPVKQRAGLASWDARLARQMNQGT
jgi:hypothetical protein